MVTHAEARPQVRDADKSDWFGPRSQMLLRVAAVEEMIPDLRVFAAGTGESRTSGAPNFILRHFRFGWTIGSQH